MRRGGALIATEGSSLYTDWRERRRDFALGDLLHVTAPKWRGAHMPEAILPGGPVRSEFGRGRVTYIPQIKASIPKPRSVSMTSQYWKLPVNSQEIVDEVRWAAGGEFSLEVEAPPTVTSELLEQKGTGMLFVHLLNYDDERNAQVGNVRVKLRIPEGKQVKAIEVISPDEDAPANDSTHRERTVGHIRSAPSRHLQRGACQSTVAGTVVHHTFLNGRVLSRQATLSLEDQSLARSPASDCISRAVRIA